MVILFRPYQPFLQQIHFNSSLGIGINFAECGLRIGDPEIVTSTLKFLPKCFLWTRTRTSASSPSLAVSL